MYISATRVVFIFPYGTNPHYRAALFRILNRIKVELFLNFRGQMTFSHYDPTVFSGHFWHPNKIWQNEHVIIFVDVPDKSQIEIYPILANLRLEIDSELAKVLSSQPAKRVWISTQPLSILHS